MVIPTDAVRLMLIMAACFASLGILSSVSTFVRDFRR